MVVFCNTIACVLLGKDWEPRLVDALGFVG